MTERGATWVKDEAYRKKRALEANSTQGGLSKTPTYNSWNAMINRCARPANGRYSSYGGRGVTVCDRWRFSFKAFLADMGERPHGTTLDRIDNNGNYEPGNCRWATLIEQQENRSVTKMLTAFGETLSVAEWRRRTGLSQSTLNWRLKKMGLGAEDALSRAVKKTGRPKRQAHLAPDAPERRLNKSGFVLLSAFGTENLISDWAKRSGLTAQTIRARLKNGWTSEEAVATPLHHLPKRLATK